MSYKMKLINLLFALLLLCYGCRNNRNAPIVLAEPVPVPSEEKVIKEREERNEDPSIERGINLFEKFFLNIKCPCELQQDVNPGVQISFTYKCFDTNNNAFYRVAIESHKDILDSLGLSEIDSAFVREFLTQYKSKLTINQTDFKDIEIYGYKGVQYQQILSVDGTSMYNTSIILLAHSYSYTFSVMTINQKDINFFYSFINSLTFLDSGLNSTPISKSNANRYVSPKYKYSIDIPLKFYIEDPKGRNIDLKLANEIGCSFTTNITERLSEEYSINAHDYSKQIMESLMRPSFPNFMISQSEKVIIDDEKAFLYIYSNNDGLTALGCYIFHGDKVYLLTGSAPADYFESYKSPFLNSILSLKF